LIGQNQRPVTVLAIFTQNSLCYGWPNAIIYCIQLILK
jgi:hypothetical protein